MNKIACLAGIMMLLSLVGCGGLVIKMETEAPKGISKADLEGITLYATRTINCKDEEFSYLYSKEDDLHYMKGCGDKIPFSYECVRDTCFWINLYALKKRAAFDLNCKSELDAVKISIFSWGVSGCENRATYELIEGRWIMNGSSK